MTEFSKTKIAYALALLAALFALSPLVNSSVFSFSFFSVEIKIQLLYWIFVGLLAVTVYMYALSLIKEENVHNTFHKTGNYIYAISLLFPPAVLAIYIISVITIFIINKSDSKEFGYVLQVVLSVGVGAITSVLTNKITTRFKTNEDKRKDSIEKLSEIMALERAKKMLDTEMYDLTTIELWKVIEMTFKRVFKARAIPYDDKKTYEIIGIIEKYKLLPKELIQELQYLRAMRNKSAHTQVNVTKAEISKSILSVEKILAIVDNYTEECYYCRKNYPLDKMDVEEINGDYYVCEDCAKEHPNWKDEILSMGMDS